MSEDNGYATMEQDTQEEIEKRKSHPPQLAKYFHIAEADIHEMPPKNRHYDFTLPIDGKEIRIECKTDYAQNSNLWLELMENVQKDDIIQVLGQDEYDILDGGVGLPYNPASRYHRKILNEIDSQIPNNGFWLSTLNETQYFSVMFMDRAQFILIDVTKMRPWVRFNYERYSLGCARLTKRKDRIWSNFSVLIPITDIPPAAIVFQCPITADEMRT